MTKKMKTILAAAAAAAALGLGGVAIAGAAGGDSDGNENEVAISGSALEQASTAALEHTGGGEVTDTEVGDEESYYEVEVTLDDGSHTDVQLDRSFNVVGSEADGQDG